MNFRNSSPKALLYLSRTHRLFTVRLDLSPHSSWTQPRPLSPSVVLLPPPKAWWCEEAKLATRDRRTVTLWGVSFRGSPPRIGLVYVKASRRASSVSSRAKAEMWQATYNLSPLSYPCAVFNLLKTVAGKKGASRDPEFTNSQSPKDTANTYASFLRSQFSQ